MMSMSLTQWWLGGGCQVFNPHLLLPITTISIILWLPTVLTPPCWYETYQSAGTSSWVTSRLCRHGRRSHQSHLKSWTWRHLERHFAHNWINERHFGDNWIHERFLETIELKSFRDNPNTAVTPLSSLFNSTLPVFPVALICLSYTTYESDQSVWK